MAEKLQEQLDSQRKKVDVDHFDLTVRELVRMAEQNELHRAPEYQRHFRWDEETESRLIESLFLGLPVPSLFVATNADGTWEVVDGLQRLSTLLHFVSEDEKSLEDVGKDDNLLLQGLEKLPDFNGKTFASLPVPLQLAFGRRGLRVTALSDKSDSEARFEMFERLNTGGVALTAQEVRACIFQGPFNEMLRDLAESKTFKSMVKLQKTRQDDGTREELVLKFFAYLNDRTRFDGAVTQFLNNYMERAAKDFDISAGRELFHEVVDRIGSLLDGKPFVRKGYANTPINQLEAVMVGAGELIREDAPFGTPKSDWLNDEELIASSTKGTNTTTNLRRRIKRAKELLAA